MGSPPMDLPRASGNAACVSWKAAELDDAAEGHDLAFRIGEFDADRIPARNDGHTRRDGAHGARNVVGEPDHPRRLRSTRGLQLEESDDGAWVNSRYPPLHAEVAQHAHKRGGARHIGGIARIYLLRDPGGRSEQRDRGKRRGESLMVLFIRGIGREAAILHINERLAPFEHVSPILENALGAVSRAFDGVVRQAAQRRRCLGVLTAIAFGARPIGAPAPRTEERLDARIFEDTRFFEDARPHILGGFPLGLTRRRPGWLQRAKIGRQR